ncbi:MAG: recombinase family protein [Clostridia bacterium]|nr:recombinase family protein [Clostridia bacterium]
MKDKYCAGVKRSQQTKYGYKRVEGDIDRLEIDPVAEPVVREIFKMASEGISYSRISSILNSRGVMSNRARLNQLYGKEDETDGQWRNSSIFKILNDPVYHGEWKCFQDGKETIRLCPAYISREEQDVIILANTRKQHGPKLEDIFKHFVFDEETGTELVTCYSKKEGTSTYRFFDKNKKTIKNKTVVVTCSELNQIVVDRILEEKREAEEAADFLDSEAGTICVRNQLLQCKSEAAVVFKELVSVVDRIAVSEDEPSEEDLMLSAKADKIEAELELLSDWFDQKKKTLSVNNLWLRRYMTFEKKELATKQEISEYVDRIVFDRYGNCRIELLFQDEKKALKNLMGERGEQICRGKAEDS